MRLVDLFLYQITSISMYSPNGLVEIRLVPHRFKSNKFIWFIFYKNDHLVSGRGNAKEFTQLGLARAIRLLNKDAQFHSAMELVNLSYKIQGEFDERH